LAVVAYLRNISPAAIKPVAINSQAVKLKPVLVTAG
jgi:hypothetical protein